MPVSRGTRRRFLQQMSLAAAGSLVAARVTFGQARELVADTTLGKVRGLTIDGVHWFRGIPYGGDTAGRNRFMPPTRPRPWTGVRDCTDWGHIAPRPVSSNPPGEYTLAVGWNNHRGGLSEDCLNINVWTGALRDGGNRAVMEADRKSAQGAAPAFMYRWDWPAPAANGRWGATHGTDLSPALANPTTPMSMNTPEAQLMARRIGTAFIAFAKSGKPDSPEIPHWPAYDAGRRPVMVFDRQTRVEADPNRALRQLWDRLLA
jgi:carboxylesterase type B